MIPFSWNITLKLPEIIQSWFDNSFILLKINTKQETQLGRTKASPWKNPKTPRLGSTFTQGSEQQATTFLGKNKTKNKRTPHFSPMSFKYTWKVFIVNPELVRCPTRPLSTYQSPIITKVQWNVGQNTFKCVYACLNAQCINLSINLTLNQMSIAIKCFSYFTWSWCNLVIVVLEGGQYLGNLLRML